MNPGINFASKGCPGSISIAFIFQNIKLFVNVRKMAIVSHCAKTWNANKIDHAPRENSLLIETAAQLPSRKELPHIAATRL